ncbi:MAG TPA: hypothetical protein VFE96_04615 [Candidatus Bathyarchaeia archaeon]|nr:hypothetical protein [Candidatus Bathyarchaeia archaeon]
MSTKMGLAPEFFTILGIVIFLAVSLLSALLENNVPRILQYLFQVAAAVGLGTLLFGQFVNDGPSSSTIISPTRVWIGVLYLSSAVSSLVGLNAYLATIRRPTAKSSILSGFVTAPTLVISLVLVSTFLGTSGQGDLPPGTIMVLAFLAIAISFGVSSFLREASRPFSIAHSKGSLSPTLPAPQPSEPSRTPLPSLFSSKTEDGWETAPRKQENET